MTWRDRGEPVHESFCGCPLPLGCWGEGGWHHEAYTLAKLREMAEAEADREMSKVAALHGALSLFGTEPVSRLVDGGARQQIVKDWLTAHASLVGVAYAYERCSAYRAAMQRKLDKTKSKKRSGREAD